MVRRAGACFSSAGLMGCQQCLEGNFVNTTWRLAVFATNTMLLCAQLPGCSITCVTLELTLKTLVCSEIKMKKICL